MAISLADLNVTENYADNTKLTQAQLNTAVASSETYCNDTLKDNLVQLALDVMGSASTYTFDSDGAANLTNSVYDKQTSVATYNSADINIGTSADVSWIDVDATNVKVTITPEMVGKYKVVFRFCHHSQSTVGNGLQTFVKFRITDSTDSSNFIMSGWNMGAVAATAQEGITPITIEHIFTWNTTAARTIKLQKWVQTIATAAFNRVASSATNGEVYMTVEKI